MAVIRADPSQMGVILIDVQPFFWEFAFENNEEVKNAVMIRLEHLLMLADWFELPIITTFEHPTDRNGKLPDELERVFPERGQQFTKRTYDLTSEPDIREAIEKMGVKQLAVAGAETDVCVMQSTLGLLEMGYEVFLLEDCLFTTEPYPGFALRRLYQAGAVPSTFKSFAYELTKSVEHTPWIETWVDRETGKPLPEAFQYPEIFPPWVPKI
jgi:nicotinamidase-related amidase